MIDFDLAGFRLHSVRWPPPWERYARDRLPFEAREGRPSIEVRYEGACSAPVSDASLELEDAGFSFRAPGTTGAFDPQSGVLSVRGGDADPERSLNNALRLWTSVMLPRERDGLMLHAASCIAEGRGVVLAGLSGAGKSTFANGLSEAVYLSDDITLLDRLSTSPTLLATPFYGSLGRVGADAEAPLHVVGLLRHAAGATEITRLSPAAAAASLFRHVVAFSADRRLSGPILERVSALVSRVAVFDVARSLSDTSDDLCRALLRAESGS